MESTPYLVPSRRPSNEIPVERDYRFESVRLQSYDNWPVRFMEPAALAAAGLYYTGFMDRVRCFECDIVIARWEEYDNLMTEHQLWRPSCPFVRQRPCGNIPIQANSDATPTQNSRSNPEGRLEGASALPSSNPTGPPLMNTLKLGMINLTEHIEPTHPEFVSLDARIKSFTSWPLSMFLSKEKLAEAGFYYTGESDQTVCHHCGGGLNDWQPYEDPWEQHAKWFSKCYYLKLMKGQPFIHKILNRPVQPPSEQEFMEMTLPYYIQKLKLSTPEKDEPKSQEINSLPEPGPVDQGTEDARKCKICYGKELGIIFLPCGHVVACTQCATSMSNCPVCRDPIRMTARAIIV